jgi:transcriptional regulator with XRE-family HTH domain
MATPRRYLLLDAHPAFVERMFVLEELVGNKSKLASRAGISNSGMRHYFFGKGEPTRPQLIALAHAAGVNVSWLTTGDGPLRPVSPETKAFIVEAFARYRKAGMPDTRETRIGFVKAYNGGVVVPAPEVNKLSVYELNDWLTEYAATVAHGSDYVRVRFYDLDDPSNDMAEIDFDAFVGSKAPLCFNHSVAVGRWKLDVEKAKLFAVSSDDVDGPFRPHDWVLCDCRKAESPRSGIYLIRTADGYVFRRVQFLDNGRIRIVREQPAGAGQTEYFAEEQNSRDVELIGRAFGYWRRVRT